jgi:hypothetical protein
MSFHKISVIHQESQLDKIFIPQTYKNTVIKNNSYIKNSPYT